MIKCMSWYYTQRPYDLENGYSLHYKHLGPLPSNSADLLEMLIQINFLLFWFTKVWTACKPMNQQLIDIDF